MAGNVTAGAAAAASPTVPKVQHQIISISVDLGVTTPDNLRHIDFGLEKDSADDGTVSWTIDFKFQERENTTDNFTDIVTLNVQVKSKNNAMAQATATQGLSDAQVTHLLGPVTIASQQLSQKQTTESQVSRLVEATIPKHAA